VNFSVDVALFDCGPCCALYSLHYKGEEKSEYEQLAYGKRFNAFRYREARDYILGSLILMRDEVGADYDMLRYEGKPTDFLCCLPEKGAVMGTKLRVMCLRPSVDILIIGGAGIKSGRTSSEGEIGDIEAELYAIDRELRRMIMDSEIRYCMEPSKPGFLDKTGAFLSHFTLVVNEEDAEN
jgi:hypothetical protein